MRNTMEARALEEQERVEQEQFDTVTNNYTAQLVSGALKPDAPVLQQLKATRPDMYEDVMTRSSNLAEAEQELRGNVGEEAGATLDEAYFDVFDNPAEAYAAYKKALEVAPAAANTNAINARKQIDVARAKSGTDSETTYKWTTAAESRVSRVVRARINTLATSQPRVEKEGFFGSSQVSSEFTQRIAKMGNKRNNQGRALNDLVAEIVNSMINGGTEPTDENISQAIADRLSTESWAEGVDFGVTPTEVKENVDASKVPATGDEDEGQTEKKSATDYL